MQARSGETALAGSNEEAAPCVCVCVCARARVRVPCAGEIGMIRELNFPFRLRSVRAKTACKLLFLSMDDLHNHIKVPHEAARSQPGSKRHTVPHEATPVKSHSSRVSC